MMRYDSCMSPDHVPNIPLGNHEPSELATFLFDDFATAWNAMASCSPEPTVGGNLMFARQALAYLELACRTASSHNTNIYLERFGTRLAERDGRYFTVLPSSVPLPRDDDLRLPAAPERPANVQLLAALFDTARHGLAHLSQQIPVRLSDDKIWRVSFTGVQPGEHMSETLPAERRDGHLAFTVSPKGHIRLVVRPDVLLTDLRWAARGAAIFSQFLAPRYPERPRPSRQRVRDSSYRPHQDYSFSSAQLASALETGGHVRLLDG
jgi:hypothetical protein